MTDPGLRDQLLNEGRKQARIYGVSMECAEVYAEGWRAAIEAAQPAVEERERELSLARRRIAELERLERDATQHAFDAEADRDRERANVANAKAETARLRERLSTSNADTYGMYVKQYDERQALQDRIANLLAECDTRGWISTCEVRELLGKPCADGDPCAEAEKRPQVHVDVSDWDSPEDAVYDKPPEHVELSREEWYAAANKRLDELGVTYLELARMNREGNFKSHQHQVLWVLIGGTLDEEKRVEYREPDCWIDNDGRMQCNRCKDQVLAFKDGGWACKCDSAMFEHAKPEEIEP